MSLSRPKVGEVALAKYPGEDPKQYTYGQKFGDPQLMWIGTDGMTSRNFSAAEWVHLLNVIDREDDKVLDRFARLHTEQPGYRGTPWKERLPENRARVLRELRQTFGDMLLPEKPPEPTNLGAVVEDAYGEIWVRMSACRGDIVHAWAKADSRGSDVFAPYHSINAVKIHGEGTVVS